MESEGLAALSPIGAAGPAYGVDCGLIVSVCEREGDVLVLDEADGCCESEVASEEDGFGIADAEGAAAVEPIHKGWGDVFDVEFGVAGEWRSEKRCGEDWGGVGIHSGAKEGDVG